MWRYCSSGSAPVVCEKGTALGTCRIVHTEGHPLQADFTAYRRHRYSCTINETFIGSRYTSTLYHHYLGWHAANVEAVAAHGMLLHQGAGLPQPVRHDDTQQPRRTRPNHHLFRVFWFCTHTITIPIATLPFSTASPSSNTTQSSTQQHHHHECRDTGGRGHTQGISRYQIRLDQPSRIYKLGLTAQLSSAQLDQTAEEA